MSPSNQPLCWKRREKGLGIEGLSVIVRFAKPAPTRLPCHTLAPSSKPSQPLARCTQQIAAVHPFAMAKRRTSVGKPAKPEARQPRNTVPKYMLFAKHSLAPYPDETGNPLYSGDIDAEEFLEPKSVAKSRTPGNCEYLHRPGMALSLAAAALNVGFQEAQKNKGKLAGMDVLTKLAKDSPDLVKAIKVLDTGKTRIPDRKAMTKAVDQLVTSAQSLTDKDRKGLNDLALSAGRIYLFAMNALETCDLLQNPKIYARKFEKTAQKLPKEGTAWIRAPEDADKLKAMLAKSLEEKVNKNKKRNKKATMSKDAGSDDNDQDSASAGSAETSQASPTPPRKRKAAKDGSPSPSKAPKTRKKEEKPDDQPIASPLSPESSSEPAEDEASASLLAWSTEDIGLVTKDVDDGLLHYQDKKKRLTLAGIVALLDNIPPEVLKLGDLTDTHTTLKTMSRLPRPEQVKKVLDKMKALLTRALAAHGLPADAPRDLPEKEPEGAEAK